MIEVDERTFGPERYAHLFPGHNFSRPLDQHPEHLEWLVLELDAQTVLSQFRLFEIDLKEAKTNDAAVAIHY